MPFSLAQKLVATSVVPPLARELASQINAGVYNTRRLTELGIVPSLASYLSTSLLGNSFSPVRAMEMGMVEATALAIANAYASESLAYFARLSATPSSSQRIEINDAIQRMKQAGAYQLLDALWIPGAGFGREDSKINVVSASYPLTEVDAANITFAQGVGFTGNGTSSYMLTGFNPATAPSPKFTQNSASIGFWSQTSAASAGIEMGNSNAVLQCRNGTNVMGHRVNTNTSGSVINLADGSGFFVSSRTNPSTNLPYKDGVALSVNAAPGTSAAPGNVEMRLLGRFDGSVATYSIRTCSLAFIGAGLTQAQIQSIYDAFV